VHNLAAIGPIACFAIFVMLVAARILDRKRAAAKVYGREGLLPRWVPRVMGGLILIVGIAGLFHSTTWSTEAIAFFPPVIALWLISPAMIILGLFLILIAGFDVPARGDATPGAVREPQSSKSSLGEHPGR
jgi:hypothetical protein